MPDDLSSSGPEISALLRDAATGDEPAWRRLVEMYGRRVYALAQSRCRDPELAEEVTQSVFVTVATKLSQGGYAEQGRFEAWLFRVAMNRIRDEARRSRRRAHGGEELRDGLDAPASAPDPSEPSQSDRELTSLRAALARLPEADREVVELRHHGQMSFRQIAEMLQEPVGTLLARHHRALRKLKDLMTDDLGDEPDESPAAADRSHAPRRQGPAGPAVSPALSNPVSTSIPRPIHPSATPSANQTRVGDDRPASNPGPTRRNKP